MFPSFLYYCLMYLSSLILFLVWLKYSKRLKFRLYFSINWSFLLLLQAFIGYIRWQPTNSCTAAGDAIICSSPLWLTGLLMLITPRNKFTMFLVPLLCFALPHLSLYISLIILGCTKPFTLI